MTTQYVCNQPKFNLKEVGQQFRRKSFEYTDVRNRHDESVRFVKNRIKEIHAVENATELSFIVEENLRLERQVEALERDNEYFKNELRRIYSGKRLRMNSMAVLTVSTGLLVLQPLFKFTLIHPGVLGASIVGAIGLCVMSFMDR